MNTEVMKTFCDLVDMGSFSRAAEANYISQSAVSQQLAKLEREIATQLINRSRGLVEPTEAGKAFYRGAKEILRRQEMLLGEVRSAVDAVRGVLRVGTIYSVGFFLLDPYIRKFLRAHPEVKFHVEYTHWTRIYSAVVSGEMDLGVVACPERHRSIEVIPLMEEELVLVCAPDHRLARRGSIAPADLAGEDFVAFGRGIPTRRHLDRILKAKRVKVNAVMEFDNIELLKRAVEIGAGISILPRDSIQREVAGKHLCFARFGRSAGWVRPVGILRRRGKAPGPAERMFLAMLRSKT